MRQCDEENKYVNVIHFYNRHLTIAEYSTNKDTQRLDGKAQIHNTEEIIELRRDILSVNQSFDSTRSNINTHVGFSHPV